MKKMIKLLVVAIVATTGTTYAQYAGDAIRFGNTNYGSSARFKGMGGAQIGVGGDMSSLGGNPAGLGLFTRSEFSLTPEFNATSAKADYLNQKTNVSQNKMNLNHAGIVWYNPTLKVQGQDTRKGVVSTVFGIGYNRNNDYTQRYSYEGNNTNTTMRDFFAEEANRYMDNNGNTDDGSLESQAFKAYLINFNGNNYTAEPFSANMQRKNETTTGSTAEVNFSGALNISNKLYIGASVGIVNVRYISDAEYVETGEVNYDPGTPNSTEDYQMSFTQRQETTGSGFNGRLGLIFRPVSNFRIGATLQTPTWLYIDDEYSEILDNRLSGGTIDDFNPTWASDPYSYRLKTPLKGSLGASYVIGGQAIISADVDYIDYATTRFSTSDGGETATIRDNNADIRALYTSAINYRIGGEYKIDQLNIRAGFGLNGTPMKDDDKNVYARKSYTAGLGYRINEYYFDLAYQRIDSENRFTPYSLNAGDEPVASVKNANNNIFLTFGLRF